MIPLPPQTSKDTRRMDNTKMLSPKAELKRRGVKVGPLGTSAFNGSWSQGVVRARNLSKKPPSFLRSLKGVSSWMDSSISSIQEGEPVLCFDESGLSSLSSLSQLTFSSSSNSLQMTKRPTTQGPSLFESTNGELRCALAPRMPTRANEQQEVEHDHDDDSDRSLGLDDILEESNHSASSHHTTGRQWSTTGGEKAARMPTRLLGPDSRVESFSHESSTTIYFSDGSLSDGLVESFTSFSNGSTSCDSFYSELN